MDMILEVYVLVQESGRVFTRPELIRECKGTDYPATPKSVDVAIHMLRRKIGPTLIRTIHGIATPSPSDGSVHAKTSPKTVLIRPARPFYAKEDAGFEGFLAAMLRGSCFVVAPKKRLVMTRNMRYFCFSP
jgi:hypothetical protein